MTTDQPAPPINRRRDGWAPADPLDYGPLFTWPTRPLRIARWFITDYLLSWQLLYFAVATAIWFWLTPSVATMSTLSPGWIAYLLVRNLVFVTVWYGGWHYWLYIRRAQGTSTKYTAKWPGASRRFRFGDQTRENVFWTMVSGVPIATAFEVIGLWLFASGRIPWVRWVDHPIYIIAIMLLIPLWREVHFYAIHRLLHVPALYRRFHALHHRNVNPSPWSGLSMHPVEQALYLSAMAIHWVVPSNPLHMMFNQVHLLMGPVPGHAGFGSVELGEASLDTDGYAHYLHHKYFEVNYADGAIPLDRWFGSFHDGTPEALERARARRARAGSG